MSFDVLRVVVVVRVDHFWEAESRLCSLENVLFKINEFSVGFPDGDVATTPGPFLF